MSKRISKIGTGFLLVLAAGCAKSTAATNEQQAPAPAAEAPVALQAENFAGEAHTLYKTRCAVCHGNEGKGDGPGAAALNPKPRNYTDVAWQSSVTDEQIQKTILYGGAAIGKSPNMPANPDLDGKDKLVAELVKVVRDFKGK